MRHMAEKLWIIKQELIERLRRIPHISHIAVPEDPAPAPRPPLPLRAGVCVTRPPLCPSLGLRVPKTRSLVPRAVVARVVVSGHRAGWRTTPGPLHRSAEKAGRGRELGTAHMWYEPAQSAPRRECQFNYLALAHWSTVRFPYMVAPPAVPQQSPKRARVGRSLQHS